MTRRDYELLSATIKALHAAMVADRGTAWAEVIGVKRAAHAIGAAIKAENPRFDLGRFLVDAGVV